ncbi:MAG: MBL fold metallo-hydrolase [Chitinophagaceae bacterium]
MSLSITSLNSGSNGNCYYIGNEQDAILVDAGISCRETERRMTRLGLNMRKIRAIFISHEHSDHIKGLEILVKKYGFPVYITRDTLTGSSLKLPETTPVHHFCAGKPVMIGALQVIPFPKLHDAAEPHSFCIRYNGIVVGVFTDIGFPCANVVHHFRQCHAVFLETNYDEAMLENGNYPYHLKRRIKGGAGHLSNTQALELFKKEKPPFMSHVFLSHLSRDNNDPEQALQLFRQHAGNTEIVLASRFEETPLFHIGTAVSGKPVQLPLFS